LDSVRDVDPRSEDWDVLSDFDMNRIGKSLSIVDLCGFLGAKLHRFAFLLLDELLGSLLSPCLRVWLSRSFLLPTTGCANPLTSL
jgi:hypothetical protein